MLQVWQNKMENKKYVYAIDGILLVGTLAGLFLVLFSLGVGATGMAVGPVHDSNDVLFYFDKGNKLLVDERIDFLDYEKFDIKEGTKIFFKPGIYYLMVSENEDLNDEVIEFTIESEVELKIKELDGKYGLVNAEDFRLNVDVYEEDVLVENIKLEGLNE